MGIICVEGGELGQTQRYSLISNATRGSWSKYRIAPDFIPFSRSATDLYFGCGIRVNGVTAGNLLMLTPGTQNFYLGAETGGGNHWQVRQGFGGTLLITSNSTFLILSWYWVELHVQYVSTTYVNIELRVNEVSEGTFSGSVSAMSSASANGVNLYSDGLSIDHQHDDLIVVDTVDDGSGLNTDWPGDTRIYGIFPYGDGTTQELDNFPAGSPTGNGYATEVLNDSPKGYWKLSEVPNGSLAFDATSNVAAGTGNLSWTHTPVGTPRGVLVLIVQNSQTSDQVSSVTYGGVTMTRVSSNFHTNGTEDGVLYAYFLGVGVPTGAQTVTVTVSSTASKRAVAVSVTADSDTGVEKVGSLDSAGTADPSASVTPTREAIVVGALHSGQDDPSSITIADSAVFTEILEHDFGNQTASWQYTPTKRSAGAQTTAGWLAASEEAGVLVCAIARHPRADDSSGNAHHGTYQGYAGLSSPGIFGYADSNLAIKVSGSISVPDHSDFNPTTSLSLEAWVFWQGTSVSSNDMNHTVIRKSGQYELRCDQSTATENHMSVEFALTTGAETILATATAQTTKGEWHHLVATYDGTNMRIYIDGSEVTSTGKTGNIASTSNIINIGGGSGQFVGYLDEVAMYASVLSATDVAQHYGEGRRAFHGILSKPPATNGGSSSVTNASHEALYIGSNVLNEISLAELEDKNVGTNLAGVRVTILARRNDGGVAKFAPVARFSGSNDVGADITLKGSWEYYDIDYDGNPLLSDTAWNEADLNATQWGIKVR